MDYRFDQRTGALKEGHAEPTTSSLGRRTRPGNRIPKATSTAARTRPTPLAGRQVPTDVVCLIPESVARDIEVMPLEFDGERLTIAAADPDDIAVADKLRFILAKDVRLVPADRGEILAAINRHYGQIPGESADSMLREFTDLTALAFSETDSTEDHDAPTETTIPRRARQPLPRNERMSYFAGPSHQEQASMFHYVVSEGERVSMTRRDGKREILVGPMRVWSWGREFQPLDHFVAHPGQYLQVRYRDGRQEHLPGPAEWWLDPRSHEAVEVAEALQLAAKEAVVVYTRDHDGATTRRIVYGPTLFIPQPGEWLHRFSWHASKGGSRGVEKVPNGLVFQKLWLMPDQMYHDVRDVRTSDDAVLTIRLMIFFELIDINRMLEATHDPIGDFVNAATADVIEFTARHDFDSFKRSTAALNDLATYRQLSGRAAQCGYKIANVVYRGYGAAESLQQMHDQAIEARTKLQLDRATEQQSQDLENYRLESQLARAAKRRAEQTDEVRHDLELNRQKAEHDLQLRERQQTFVREQRQADARVRDEVDRMAAAQQQARLLGLRDLGVDLTAYLTQHRADRVIEVRGNAAPHLHVDRLEGDAEEKTKSD